MSSAQTDMIKLPEQGRKVTQEYFDSIVAENINDFEMTTQEAIEDAINQCKSQGCDISTICKFSKEEQTAFLDSLKKLDSLIPVILSFDSTKLTATEREAEVIETMDKTLEVLSIIKENFEKDLSFRVLATKMEAPNAYAIFMKFFIKLQAPSASTDQSSNNKFNEFSMAFINTFQSYLHQQSDVLDTEGLKALIRLTDSNENDQAGTDIFTKSQILSAILKCINTSCQLCESNRQFFVENGLCENLMKLFQKHKTDDQVLNTASMIIRSLLLDDDIRHAFGKSHEHAKFIASQLNGIDVLIHIGLDNDNNLSDGTLANLMLTLSKLAVRNEFCQEICDKGGLKFVLKCIEQKHLKNIALIKSSLSLLKSICNNDQVKYEATKSNAIELLRSVLDVYAANNYVCELTCAALSVLLLRNVESSKQLYALDVHRSLIQLLCIHVKNPKLVKPCCLALRNSISRNKEMISKLIELKIEEILRTIWNDKTMTSVHDEVKAVLRDCGLSCDLKELWTGSNIQMQNDPC